MRDLTGDRVLLEVERLLAIGYWPIVKDMRPSNRGAFLLGELDSPGIRVRTAERQLAGLEGIHRCTSRVYCWYDSPNRRRSAGSS